MKPYSQWITYGLVLLLSGLLSSLAACTPSSPSLSGSQPAGVQAVANQAQSKADLAFGPKLPLETFVPPEKIAVEGERRTIYVDPDTGTRMHLIKPTLPEKVKAELLNQFQTQQVVDLNQLNRASRIRYNPSYCQIYVVEVELEEDFKPEGKCHATRFNVNINGEQWAEFPAVKLRPIPGSSYSANLVDAIPNQRFIFAPCAEACEQPLQVEIFKTPGKSCRLEGNKYVNLDSADPVAKFEYDDCNNTDEAHLYFDEGVRNLLDSVEKRVDVMNRDVELLVRDVEQEFPDAPPFSTQSVSIPPDYYQPAAGGFSTQQVDLHPI